MPVKEKENRNRKIVELHRSGQSFGEIAERFGIHRSTASSVYYRFHKKYSRT